MQTRVVLA